MKVKLKKHKKSPAPLVAEQVSKRPKIMNNLYSSIEEIQEITDFSKACALLRTEKWICLRIFAHKNILTFLLCRFE